MKWKSNQLLHVFLSHADKHMPVGRLAYQNRQIYFEYDPAFLKTNLEISPFKLPLKAGVHRGDNHIFEGLFGVFNDSLPDGWGRLLLDRRLKKLAIDSNALTPLDRLAYVGKHGMGALLYEPDKSSIEGDAHVLDLDVLAEESLHILEGDSDGILEELLQLGGSSAGARPKVMVGVDHSFQNIIYGVDALNNHYSHWMIKFRNTEDPLDIAAIEYAYSNMAIKAGLEMMPTHLFPSRKGIGHFGVKRFDRNGNEKVHMHTACGLFHADFRIPSLDYKELLQGTFLLTKNHLEVQKMFRLAAFNVFAYNRDDHSKNFSFLMDNNGEWHLAPAYDLTFSAGPGGEHSTSVMGEGKNPGVTELMKLAEVNHIKPADAKECIEQVKASIAEWPSLAKEAGVSATSSKQISDVLSAIN